MNIAPVDDDATIILQYPQAQAVLMPSWNWTFGRQGYGALWDEGLCHCGESDRGADPIQ